MTLQGNAGCLILNGDNLITVTQRFTTKLSLPGGTGQRGESAQCTAWRETKEEIGADVEVKQHLKTFSNGFHLFACDLKSKPDDNGSDWLEVASVQWKPITEITEDNWRFPAHLTELKALFVN
ncbi:NUDIX domain-containing protein [Corallincola platygyrae]|uniref:NUDIX domain-containing protein n=1 Tax=Corallincola platygyrae TaxID=1193278 RepID=A0ABW4XHQ1_9GAMM